MATANAPTLLEAGPTSGASKTVVATEEQAPQALLAAALGEMRAEDKPEEGAAGTEHNPLFQRIRTITLPEVDGELMEPLHARVYHKRNISGLHFLDTILIDEQESCHVVEFIICGQDAALAHVKEVKVGDVIEVTKGMVDAERPRAPRSAIIRCSAFSVVERWSETLGVQGKGMVLAFHRPLMHDGINNGLENREGDRKQQHEAKKAEKRAEGASSGAAPSDDSQQQARPPADRIPLAIMQCHLPLAERVATYFNGAVLSNFSKDRLVMVYEDYAGEAPEFQQRRRRMLLEEKIDSFFYSIIHRIYFVHPHLKEVSFARCMAKYKSMLPSESYENNFVQKRLLRAFPRSLEAKIKEMHARPLTAGEETDFAPEHRIPSHGDCLVYADGLYWLGIGVAKIGIPEKVKQTVPSGAYWKLLEIRDRYLENLGIVDRYRNRNLAIDIGASPGGWSYCSAENFGTARTLAVDPAEHMHQVVHEWYAGGKKADGAEKHVEHWRMRGDAGLRKLQEEVAAGGSKVAIFVNDMNDECENTVDLVKEFVDSQLFERPCLVNLTFKQTCKSKLEFAERKAKAMRRLETECGVSELQELHLFANTKQETTVVGQLL